jgi:hypothetical protein
MRTHFLPQTALGKWSVILSGISLLANIIFIILALRGNLNSESSPPWIGATISITVFAAFATGILAIFWRKERAFLVYLGMLAQALIFILGEFQVAH